MIRDFRLVIPAGEERYIDAVGDFVFGYQADHEAFDLAVDSGGYTLFAQALTYYPDQRFAVVRVRNRSTLAALTVTLLIGLGRIEDHRQVSSTPGGFIPETVEGLRAIGFRAQRGFTAAAGDRIHVQLWNPPGSGVLGVVKRIYVHGDVGGQIAVFEHASALATDHQNSRSVYFGDPVGSLSWRSQNQPAKINPASGVYLISLRVLPGGFLDLGFDVPLFIPEGWGLVFRTEEVGPLEFSVGGALLELPA